MNVINVWKFPTIWVIWKIGNLQEKVKKVQKLDIAKSAKEVKKVQKKLRKCEIRYISAVVIYYLYIIDAWAHKTQGKRTEEWRNGNTRYQ